MNKIACVVLTYNRLILLQKCIAGIRRQTYKYFDIYVVDNASTDDTSIWLYQQNDLNIITLNKNEGCANGFYTCIQSVYDKGYEWIWMMDDDGVPNENQLKELIICSEKHNILFFNALVCDIDNTQNLAFSFSEKERTIEDIKGCELLIGIVHAFNGSFINRHIIESIGNVRKQLCWWYIEIDYVCRIKKAGFLVATVVSAIHYHPSGKIKGTRIIPGLKCIVYPYPLNQFVAFRNRAYVNYTYLGKKAVLKDVAKYMLYYLLRIRLKEFLWCCKYSIQGCKGIVGNGEKIV